MIEKKKKQWEGRGGEEEDEGSEEEEEASEVEEEDKQGTTQGWTRSEVKKKKHGQDSYVGKRQQNERMKNEKWQTKNKWWGISK